MLLKIVWDLENQTMENYSEVHENHKLLDVLNFF